MLPPSGNTARVSPGLFRESMQAIAPRSTGSLLRGSVKEPLSHACVMPESEVRYEAVRAILLYTHRNRMEMVTMEQFFSRLPRLLTGDLNNMLEDIVKEYSVGRSRNVEYDDVVGLKKILLNNTSEKI